MDGEGRQVSFRELLHGMTSSENDKREEAEKIYQDTDSATSCVQLLQSINDNDLSVELKDLSAVLLRRLIMTDFDAIWPKFSEDDKSNFKRTLLETTQKESSRSTRRKCVDVISELARKFIDDDGKNSWPEILEYLFRCASADSPETREIALRILDNVPSIFGDQQPRYLGTIKEILGACLQAEYSSEDNYVKIEAAKALTSFLVANNEDQTLVNIMKDLLPLYLKVVAETIMAHDDDAVLKSLIEIAEYCPKYLRSQLDHVVAMCLKANGDVELEDSWRQTALEVIVTLAENAAGMLRKLGGQFVQTLIPQVLAMMVDLDEDVNEWLTSDEPDDEDADSNPVAGEGCLDRLSCSLGGKFVFPHISANLQQMLVHDDWRYRHAGLMAISSCAEGCQKQMSQGLEQIVQHVVVFLNDSHPRVRYAACNAIGQMSTDFGPTVQKKYHDKVVPAILVRMNDSSCPRVQAHAAAAFVNFCEDCPKSVLPPYLDLLTETIQRVLNEKLQELTQTGKRLVLEQFVTTTAALADASADLFSRYYDRFIPALKFIMVNTTNCPDELRLLRGKTIECISLIGLAVGKEKFLPDAAEVMDQLLKSQTSQEEFKDDDPQLSFLISAWTRLCKVMGPDFVAYLPVVLPPVMKVASMQPQLAIVDEEDVESLDDDKDWQFITLEDKKSFGIRTSALEDKATACEMLVCYARELKEGFAEYTEQVVKVMVPLLTFLFHDRVRVAAAEALPYLLDCAKIKGESYVAEMWKFIFPKLLNAMKNEPEDDVRPEFLCSFADCVQTLGKGCLSNEEISDVVNMLKEIFDKHFENQEERQKRRRDEDYDEGVEEELEDEHEDDAYCLAKVSEIIHSFFLTRGEEFLPQFELLIPYCSKLLADGQSSKDKQWGICFWDDAIEFASPASSKYEQLFAGPILSCITDSEPETRQAAAYGIGIMAQFAPAPLYDQVITEALGRLKGCIENDQARISEAASNATDNAVSALIKICKYRPALLSIDQISDNLLSSWLPIQTDVEECEHVYSFLCELILSNNMSLLGGESMTHICRIVEIFADALNADVVSDQLQLTILNVLKQIQANPTASPRLTNLSDSRKATLQKLFEKENTTVLNSSS